MQDVRVAYDARPAPKADAKATTNGDKGDFSSVKDGHQPLHCGELAAGTTHHAAAGVSRDGSLPGGLDVSIRVEIDPHDTTGATEGYGFSSKFLLSLCLSGCLSC